MGKWQPVTGLFRPSSGGFGCSNSWSALARRTMILLAWEFEASWMLRRSREPLERCWNVTMSYTPASFLRTTNHGL